jgi:hypothetical protein
MHHTNIVPVFGVGAEGGLHYYAMQRHQAFLPAARSAWHGVGDGLWPGQGRQGPGPDQHRRGGRHAPLYGPRAVPRHVRPAERRLRPGHRAL